MGYENPESIKFIKAISFRAERVKSWCAIFALLCVALLVRLPGFDGRPLWLDELWRAALITDPQFFHDYFFAPNIETAITSPVYACIVKAFAWFSVSPNSLRLSSLIPGCLAGVVAFAVVRKSGGSVALATAAGLIFCLNPDFISYSNEMKPYMFEVFIHLVCLFAWLTVLKNPNPTLEIWAGYFLIVAVTVLSTPTAIFLLPASGLTLFTQFLLAKSERKIQARNLLICVAGFTTIGLLIIPLYLFVWRYGSSAVMLSIWADGFAGPGVSHILFFGRALRDMWRAALDTGVGLPLQTYIALIALAASLLWAGVTGKIFQPLTRSFLLFFLVLLATLFLANLLKIWPLGDLRTNLFIYGYLVIFLFLFAAQIPASGVVAQTVIVLVPLTLLWHVHSAAGRAHMRTIATRLGELGPPVERTDLVLNDFSGDGRVGRAIAKSCAKQRILVFANEPFRSALIYLARIDRAHTKNLTLLNDKCVQLIAYSEVYSSPDETKDIFSRNLSHATGAWFLYSHLDTEEMAIQRHAAETFGTVDESRSYDGAGYFHLVTNRPAPLAPSPDPVVPTKR